ncbi:hypothetical protein HMPREF0372_01168 [Flavonifractor plautii ATCC 29863]|uniref:Uncharacterized protein n=1 Tax=Flavonifractor plautii ATCC 29863 TaxID=411475 RepID=G9YNU0_FLAPL|nr:hypothetical protein HMPREF0372_01168 [Flavonifractor plautii ATCC 29863]
MPNQYVNIPKPYTLTKSGQQLWAAGHKTLHFHYILTENSVFGEGVLKTLFVLIWNNNISTLMDQ